MEESVPLASAAAWSPDAAPRPKLESQILTIDRDLLRKPGEEAAAEEPPAPPSRTIDRLATLRDIARKLRQAPDAEETLQLVIDKACLCTGSEAGMLTLNAPDQRQVVSGTALGAGPYISCQLRVGGPSFGEIVLTRMSGADEYSSEDETFAELVAEYVAKAVTSLRAGTVLSREEQDFVDRITEELRGPIASTTNVLGVVLGGGAGELPDAARAYLAGAAIEGRRVLASVENLMMLAHLRPPEVREMELVALGPWLKASVERARPLAEARKLELTYEEPSTPFLVQGVPRQLDVVADQLLANAVKFTDEGGRVTVTADLSEGMVRVGVTDTGMGFDPAEANRMVDCFARAINAEAARVPGMGVGLFLANEIVKNHSGRLWLETRRDEGTQAYVALPIREADAV